MLSHDLDPQEYAEFQERIEEAVRTERHRREVSVMRRTIADRFREQGEIRGRRKPLLRLLRHHFRFVSFVSLLQ